jgi:hypothetical protein
MEYTASNMPSVYNSLNGTAAFPISTLDIARASVTVGYGGGYAPYNLMWLTPFHITHFTLPFIFLGPIIDPLIIRQILSRVPRSIRRYVTERLAMAVTKVWADKFVQISWLAEIEFLEVLGIIKFDRSSKERPDLAGQDIHQTWHVFEAKGRPSLKNIIHVLAKAKQQASRVQTIDGTVPGLTVGSVLHTQGKSLHLTLDDPPPDNDKGINAKINEEKFYLAYYHGIRAMIDLNKRKKREYSGRIYETIKVYDDNCQVSLGLLDIIHQDVKKGVHTLRNEPIKASIDEIHSIGGDGTAIFVD